MAAAPDSGAAPDSPDDELVLDQIRSGDMQALERLYADHADSARRLAVLLAGADDADDLVAEAFARVVALMSEGRGPRTNFRAYLHTVIRNRHRDILRTTRERPSSDLPWLLDGEEPRAEDLVEGIDSNGAVAALQSLPAAWQRILWHLEVEGRRPAEVAELLGMTPVAVSSLAYRARDGLRRAYLELATVGDEPRPECRWTRDRLSQHVRGDLSARTSAKVVDHVSGCASCASVLADMEAMNERLAGLVLPLVLAGGMLAGEGSSVSGSTESLATWLPDRTGDAAPAGSGTASGAAPGLGGTIASASVPTLVAAVVSGLVVIAGTVWGVSVTQGGTNQAETPPVSSSGSSNPGVSAPGTTPPSPLRLPSPSVVPPAVDARTGASADLSPDSTSATSLRVVRARPPAATKIAACGTYGSLALPATTGVRYQRTTGDGRQGNWRVTATAEEGYVLAESSPTRFSGDLGQYFPCPASIGSVVKVSQGDPATDPWDVTVTPVVTDPAPSTLRTIFIFDTGVLVTGRSGNGWTCREPGGTEVGSGTEYSFPDPGIPFTCTFDYLGTVPPPVTLSVYGQDGNAQIVDPTGTVRLADDGVVVDEHRFN